MNQKGWIRIVEASVAILLIAGVLLIVMGKESVLAPNPDSEIYNSQLIILRNIQGNETLRQAILDSSPPIESDDDSFPKNIKDAVEYLSPNYLMCKEKICEIESICNLEKTPEKSVYAQSTVIMATLTEYNPRQLKIFCWRK